MKWLAGLGVVAVVALGAYWAWHLQVAHSTFDNYYAFRGCTKLIDRTDTSAHCQTANGNTIQLVEFRGRWYLDGDLPTCWSNFCF